MVITEQILTQKLKNTGFELRERADDLAVLSNYYQQASAGNGHTIFLGGESGIGKTSLINQFLKKLGNSCNTFVGACDTLFTPRPLGPLFDIAEQIGDHFLQLFIKEKDRTILFALVLRELSSSPKPVVIVIEDIHWADEATFDFIKFLARRIARFNCLFLLSYRDTEIHDRHPLKNIYGELAPNTFSKVFLNPLSRGTVIEMAVARGYSNGDQVYSLTRGNPFYVTEILASNNKLIPERVKDSILKVFNTEQDETKKLWELLSILPSHIGSSIVKRIETDFENCIDESIASGVIVSNSGHLSFKHELFRRAIEESLSPFKRERLHKKMLAIILEDPAERGNLAQLVHHAIYANEKDIVVKMAPEAAKEATAVGAHIEASKLYKTAIKFFNEESIQKAELYESHAYECYLTNQTAAAIRSQQLALEIWRENKLRLREGNALRLLSRFLWFQGRCDEVMILAFEAIKVLENEIPTRERSLAYSNMAQLYMLGDDARGTMQWGQKAIDLAMKLEDQEVVAHVLNSIGTVLLKYSQSESEGELKLKESLSIAKKSRLHEHVARAYNSLSSSFVVSKKYKKALITFDEGLKYCEAHDLNSWIYYMLAEKSRLLLDTGEWREAEEIAISLYNGKFHPAVVKVGAMIVLIRLKIRRGELEEARMLIKEGKELAIPMGEAHRIIPLLASELELCWMTNEQLPNELISMAENTLFSEKDNSWYYGELHYWLGKCCFSKPESVNVALTEPYNIERQGDWESASEYWKNIGCPYEQALALFNGNEKHQKRAVLLLDDLGASATSAMLKARLRLLGVRNIPKGLRVSTRNNPAQLTNRQIDVLRLLKEGLNNVEIANKLFISSKTVDHHISAILSQLNVKSRTKAVVEASRIGIF